MAKKLKSVMEDNNEINDIEDLLKDQDPKVDGSDAALSEADDSADDKDTSKDDDVEVNEDDDSDKDDDKDAVNEADIEDVIAASDKVLNAKGEEDTNQGKSGGDETISEDDQFCMGDDNSDEIFEDDDSDKDDDKDAVNEDDSSDDDEDKKDLDEDDDSDKDDDKDAVNEDDSSDDDEDKDDDKMNESTLSPKELKIVMEALKIPAKNKKEIKTVFEAMVTNKIKSQKALIEKKAEKKVAKIRSELIEGVNLYATEVVKKWKDNNKPVFESKAKLARLEEGFNKLREIFVSLGLEADLNESAVASKYSVLSKKYSSLLERNQKLEAYVERIHVRDLYESYVSGLSKNQKRKFIALAETLEYDTVKDLKEKLDAIKKLFVEKKVYEDDELEDKPVNEDDFNDDGVLSPEENDVASNDALVNESVKLLMS